VINLKRITGKLRNSLPVLQIKISFDARQDALYGEGGQDEAHDLADHRDAGFANLPLPGARILFDPGPYLGKF
jgi:hypothetical protein